MSFAAGTEFLMPREKFTYSAYDMVLKISSDRESFEEDFVREEKKNKSTSELP